MFELDGGHPSVRIGDHLNHDVAILAIHRGLFWVIGMSPHPGTKLIAPVRADMRPGNEYLAEFRQFSNGDEGMCGLASFNAPLDPRAPWASIPAPGTDARSWTWARAHLLLSQARFRADRIQAATGWALVTAASFLVWTSVVLLAR